MKFTLYLQGAKPLLLASVGLANPRTEWFRETARLRGIPSKRRTDEWLDQMEYAMFMGSFYDVPGVDDVVIPAENVRQSLIRAARMSRLGTQTERAVMITEAYAPLQYKGPRTPKELWEDGHFKITRMIRGTGGASPTTYPVLRPVGAEDAVRAERNGDEPHRPHHHRHQGR